MNCRCLIGVQFLLVLLLLVYPADGGNCDVHSSCDTCLSNGCGWCSITDSCELGSTSGAFSFFSSCFENSNKNCWVFGSGSCKDMTTSCFAKGGETCNPNTTCSGHGVCSEQPYSPCECDPGYFPSASCATFCNATLNCSGNGVCTENGTCLCKHGYTGLSCLPCDTSTTCSDHGVCNPQATSAEDLCVCAPGWFPPSSCASGWEVICNALDCGACITNSSCGWCAGGDLANQCVYSQQIDCEQFAQTCPVSNSCADYASCVECAADPQCSYCESANKCQQKTTTCTKSITSAGNCSLSCSTLSAAQCANGSRCDCISCNSLCWYTADGKKAAGRDCFSPVAYSCNAGSGADIVLIIGLTVLALFAVGTLVMLGVLVWKLVSGRRATYIELK